MTIRTGFRGGREGSWRKEGDTHGAERAMTEERPTRVRWRVAALLFVLSLITYMDRMNIAITARQMMPALGLTQTEMGYVFTAFSLGYAISQVPGGWLGDRWGPRRVLAGAVTWWSVFTGLTAVAGTLPTVHLVGVLGSLLLVRFLIGVGEAAALPTFNRAVANWLAPHERGLGMSLAISGIGMGSAVTPPITAWVMVNYGWQLIFYLAAGAGLAAAAVWFFSVTDRPEEHPHINAAEIRLIHPSPARSAPAEASLGSMFRSPMVWWLILSYGCVGYASAFYMSWFYLYLVDVRSVAEMRGAWLASLPFVMIAVLCPLGGWCTDRLTSRFGVNRGRAAVAVGGLLLAALSIIVGANTDAAILAVGSLSLGAGWLYFAVGAYWASTIDLTKARAGTLSALMNTGGNLGGGLSPILTAWLAAQWGWPAALSAGAAMTLLAAVMWLRIKPAQGL